jgi:plastocyanin
MPFTWQININKTPVGPLGVTFDPNPLNDVAIGDQIFWTNNDNAQHWPALKSDGKIDNQFFMDNPIAPNSPSDTFVPDANGTLNYVCFLHQDETGTIIVG